MTDNSQNNLCLDTLSGISHCGKWIRQSTLLPALWLRVTPIARRADA